MNSKWFAVPVISYLFFLAGMFFIGLGKFASIAFADGWWTFTKDFASILGSLATAFAVPWAIWLYFKQLDKERIAKYHEQARGLLDELLAVLSKDKLLSNQIKINSLLYRLQSLIGDLDSPINANYVFALRTHIKQLFIHLKSESLFIYKGPAFQTITHNSTDFPDLTLKDRTSAVLVAHNIFSSKCYRTHEVGDYTTIVFDKLFDPQLLSKLVVIEQPICIGNFTIPAADIHWNQENLKDLFIFMPELIAAYIYVTNSKHGHDFIIRLDNERKHKRN